jgi:alkylhydroperoxidase family enzyme
MALLQDVEWEECLLEPRSDPELEREWRRQIRRPPSALRYLTPCPWVPRAMIRLDDLELVHLDFRLANLAIMVVSRDNACRYCYAAVRVLLRLVGLSDAEIERLEDALASAELDDHDRIGLEFVRRLSRASPRPTREDLKPLHEAGFGAGELRELAFVASEMVATNRITTIPALPPGGLERMHASLLLRLLRPFLQGMVHGRQRRAQPTHLSEEEKAGPFRAWVEALDGLPAARKLRAILDDAWASPLLPRRAKALIFAVVARGLTCPHSEREALRLLAEEGLEGEAAEEILAHLGSPLLDPVEAVVVPFARETLWYTPAQIQRRAREVRERIGTERFLEAVGVAAFANTICRLSIAFEIR